MSESNYSDILVKGNKKIFDGIVYDIHFPNEWINDYKKGTGPQECNNCRCFGSWRGSFVGYCLNCAECDYKYQRGCGMWGSGVEIYWVNPEKSIWKTYMKGISMDKIGDPDYIFGDTFEEFQTATDAAEVAFPPYEYLPDPYDETESIS